MLRLRWLRTGLIPRGAALPAALRVRFREHLIGWLCYGFPMAPDTGHVDTIAFFKSAGLDSVPLQRREYLHIVTLDQRGRLNAMAAGRIRAATAVHKTRARAATQRTSKRR